MKYAYIKHGDAVAQVRRLSNTSTYDTSGPDAFIGDFFRQHIDDDILVVCRTNHASQYESGRISVRSYRDGRTGIGSAVGRLLSALQVGREILRWQPDRILCGCTGELLWVAVLAAKFLGVPIVNSRHGELQARKGLTAFVSWVDRLCIRACDAIVCHGPFMTDQIHALGVCESKLFEFEVDLSGFVESDYNWSTQNKLSKFSANHKYLITFIGRMQQNKGVFDLLSAFTRLRDQVPGVGLVYVGDGKDWEVLREQVEASSFADDVLLMGRVEHRMLPNVISESTLILAPTRPEFPEGRCMVVLESLVLGVPVIVPNFGPFPYAVNNGENGLLFDPGSDLSLLDKLKSVLSNPNELEKLRSGAAVTSKQLLEYQTSFGDAVTAAFKSVSLQ